METACKIEGVLNSIFLERESVEEVLLDNSTAFRLERLKVFLDKWNLVCEGGKKFIPTLFVLVCLSLGYV